MGSEFNNFIFISGTPCGEWHSLVRFPNRGSIPEIDPYNGFHQQYFPDKSTEYEVALGFLSLDRDNKTIDLKTEDIELVKVHS